MDESSFAVRHSNGGKPADDLVVGTNEARKAMGVTDANLASAADARIAAAGNAATISAAADSGRGSATAAQLADKIHAINTAGKFKGRLVYDATNDLMMMALGATDVSKWRPLHAADGTSDITPV